LPKAIAYRDQTRSHRLQRDDQDEVDEIDGGQNCQPDEPDPHHDEDLFAEDVLRKKAEHVRLLDRAGGAVLVEVALRHSGKKKKKNVLKLNSTRF
jgi:hypothetical protein